MKSWICYASMISRSWHDNAMNHLAKSLMEPTCRRRASSPIGLSMSGGPNLVLIN
jgi:hypothetical protein